MLLLRHAEAALSALAPDAPCQLDVLGHDGHTAQAQTQTRNKSLQLLPILFQE
jgi:hypothetical protein